MERNKDKARERPRNTSIRTFKKASIHTEKQTDRRKDELADKQPS